MQDIVHSIQNIFWLKCRTRVDGHMHLEGRGQRFQSEEDFRVQEGRDRILGGHIGEEGFWLII
jgi:hypothetical protein